MRWLSARRRSEKTMEEHLFKIQKNNDICSYFNCAQCFFCRLVAGGKDPWTCEELGQQGSKGGGAQCSATAGEEHSVQGEGRVKINGCIAGSFKKRGLVRMLLIIFQRVSQSVIC